MEIHCIYGRDWDSNVYIILGEKPTIIDAGTGLHSREVINKINEFIDLKKITQIILTHEHFDHCGGVKHLFDATDSKAKIMAHIDASKKIEQGESHFARMLGSTMPKIQIDVKVKEGDAIKIGDETFTVLHTPGHTPGCICLYSEKSKSLISGDTIFSNGSFGRYDLPGGNPDHLRESIERLSKFDIEHLYPGHETIVEGNGNKHMAMTLKNIQYLI